MKIALIFGGSVTEGEVSKLSVGDFEIALQELGHNVYLLEFSKDLPLEIIKIKPDLVFNGMYGTFGEDGRLSGLLDIMQIPYTHSGFSESSFAFDKKISKQFMKELKIPTKDDIYCGKEDIKNGRWKELIRNSELKKYNKFFIKPTRDGSSIDAFVADFSLDLSDYKFKTNSKEFMIEEFIESAREVFVVILNNKAIGIEEVKPKDEFYTFESKYQEGKSIHFEPEDLDKSTISNMMKWSENLHNAIGLNCISRIDFLIDKNLQPFMSEINNNPGCTKTSIVPNVAKKIGIEFKDIVETLINNARCGI